MTDSVEAVAGQLEDLAETLADLALVRLRAVADTVASGAAPDPAVVAEEKRITRARRAVEKAARLLVERPPYTD